MLNQKMENEFPEYNAQNPFISEHYADMWKKWGDVVDIMNAQTPAVEVAEKNENLSQPQGMEKNKFHGPTSHNP